MPRILYRLFGERQRYHVATPGDWSTDEYQAMEDIAAFSLLYLAEDYARWLSKEEPLNFFVFLVPRKPKKILMKALYSSGKKQSLGRLKR